MGNQASNGCCNDGYDPNALYDREEPLQPEEEAKFMNSVVNGCDTHIVFADGTSMPCSIVYDLAGDCLHLMVDDKRRVINLRDVEDVLGVDSVAGLSNVDKSMIIDPNIVAFRLGSTQKAILIRFDDKVECKGFYQFLKEIILENQQKTSEHESSTTSPPPEEQLTVPSQTVIF
uniref:ISP3 C-terminal domain-containing protein n=1 Tax=Amblyomma aureolatum TaxID=187763 RepID=A0A1E1X0Y4_9ACAR